MQELDENGDFIFHFQIDQPEISGSTTLTDFYRQSIRELLGVVRFSSNGKAVIVDSFAFLDEPDTLFGIIHPSDGA